jgi:hypothetical protein
MLNASADLSRILEEYAYHNGKDNTWKYPKSRQMRRASLDILRIDIEDSFYYF